MENKNTKIDLYSLLIRQKIDWTSAIVAQPLSPSQAKEIFDHFECNPEPQKSKNFWRDSKNKVAAFFLKSFFKIEWEGQYFNNPESFDYFQKKLKSWNDTCAIPLRLRITRIDLASDFLDVTPLDLLPLAITNSKAQPHFSSKQLTYTDSKTGDTETIYYLSKNFILRAYRKDIEIKKKSVGGLLDNDDRKSGFYDLPELKDKIVSRLELVLKSEDSEYANDLINSGLYLEEKQFVQECLKNWAEHRTIRKITADKNKSRRPLHFITLFMRGDSAKLSVKSASFNKVKAAKVKLIDRAMKAILNSAEKHDLSSSELNEKVESFLNHYKEYIQKKPAA